MTASLASGVPTWRGGEELTLSVAGAVAPIASIALTSPVSAAASGGLGGGYSLVQGQTIAFLPPVDPSTTSATMAVTDASGTVSSVTTPIFWPLYGSYTFSLRGYLPVNWDVGPRTMAAVPAGGETSPSNFASLTSALSEGLNAFGGTPLTQLAADSSAGSTMFHVKHSAALPPSGQVQVDQVVYSYAASTPGPSDPTLSGLTATLGATTSPGTLAFHAAQAQVAYLNAPVTDLVILKNALFLDTAEGPFLTALGRNLGVDHSPAIASDDQYRALIKAVAYGPKSSVYGIQLALDALLGKGNYTIREDPVGAPCQVLISASYGATDDPTNLGWTYLGDVETDTVNQDGTISLAEAPFGVGGVYPVNAGIPDETTDLATLSGQASTAMDSNTITLAGAAVPAPLIQPDVTPLPTDIGSRIDLGGSVPGSFTVLEVRGSSWAVAQGVYPAADLATAGSDLVVTVDLDPGTYPETIGPFVYPRDIGRQVACQGKTGSIAAILDAETGTDLSTFATALTQRSNKARVTGLGLGPQSAVPFAVVPVFPSTQSVPYTAPGAYVLSNTTLTRRAPLSSSPAQVAVATSAYLSAQVAPSPADDTDILPSGSPDRYPVYLNSPFAVLDTYLSDLTAAGVRPVFQFTD